MYVAIVEDAPAGPPSVMIQTRSNSCSDPMTDRKIQIRIVGPSSGSVTYREALPGRGAVHRGRLVQLARDALQAGEEQDDREPDVLPGDDDEQRVEHELEVGQPELDEAAQPEASQQLVGQPVGLQDQQPDDRGDRLGEHVGREEDRPEQAARPRSCRLSSSASAERQRQLENQGERDDDRVVLNRLRNTGSPKAAR